MIAVTAHDDFLLELGQVLGGQVSVRPVDTIAAALEHLTGSRRLQLLMIDSRGTADLRGDVDRAHTRAPQVPIVVFAAADAEKSIASALRSSNIFAVLPIPVEPRKTAAIFEGAFAEAAEKRGGTRGAATHAAAAGHSAAASPARSGDLRAQSRSPLVAEPAPVSGAHHGAVPEELGAPPSGPRSKIILWGAVLACAAALAAGGVWFFVSGKHSSSPTGAAPPIVQTPAGAAGATSGADKGSSSPASTPNPSAGSPGASTAPSPAGAAETLPSAAAPVPAAQGTLDELLEKARLAMHERRYTEPANNSALLYYRSALGVDSTNAEARDGMERLAALLTTRFDEAVAAGRYDEAAEALAGLKVAAPGDARFGARQAQLFRGEWSSALAGANTDRAAMILHQAEQAGALPAAELAKWRAELARHQSDSRAKRFADLFNQRIREGRLIDPSEDSAKYYLQQLEQLAPENPVAQHGARDLIVACLRKARDAAVAGHSGDADQWMAEARAAGMTAADLSSYQRDVAAARARAATAESDKLAQLARQRMQDGHLADPSGDSAVHYLEQLKASSGDSPTVQSIGRELATRLVEQATSAARAGRIPEMNSDLQLAQRWGADPVLIQAVQQIVSGPRAAASQATATAGPAIPPGFAPKRIHYEAPEYPQQALDAGVSGTVTLAFTLDLDGHPQDIQVVESKPRGVFDRAAANAVSRWRYQPVVIDNVPTEIPWRTAIHFQAPKN